MTKLLVPTTIISAILRPLARFCIARGVRIQEIEQAVREAFVEASQSAIRAARGEVSVSKISVMTGIHRVEVTRLLSGESRVGERHDVLNRVIGLWSQGQAYRTESGAPRALTHQGLGSEFAELVATVSKEVSPYPILFELERIGAIQYDGDRVELRVQEYTPRGDVEHGAQVLSDDVDDLMQTVEANLGAREDPSSLHLRTWFDNIDPSSLPTIRRWVLERGAAFQREIREYLSEHDRDLNAAAPQSDDRAKVSVSVFSHSSVVEEPRVVKPKKRGRKPCAPRS